MKNWLDPILENQDLNFDQARELMNRIMSGEYEDAQIAGLLVALRAKGETVDEIAGFAQAMRDNMVRIPIEVEAIDMCGTGGDGSGTFNISTAAAFVVAGAGVPVAKHGNRSISSKSGSADVLQALGFRMDMSPEDTAKAIENVGLGFIFAPAYHPAMKHVMPARKALAIRTVFNILGPLCNPAGVNRQVMGVFDGGLLQPVGEVLQKLGATKALVVHSDDGLDELSISAGNRLVRVDSQAVASESLSPADVGLHQSELAALLGDGPEVNATIIREVIEGKKGAARDVVLFNAAAGLVVAGRTNDFKAGLSMAAEAVDSGKALQVLRQLGEV